MYSAVPAPMVEWKEENRKYSLAFFPVVGIISGLLLIGWRYLCTLLGAGQMLFAAGAVFIPFAVTGGIHIDGFCDVHDALSSCGTKERALEIMKDSHIGAFAAIHLGIYLIVQFGLFSEIMTLKSAACTAAGYVLSRAFSGLTAVNFKAAKKDGALHAFTSPADRKITTAVLSAVPVLCIAGTAFLSWTAAAAFALVSVLWCIHFHRLCMKRFGGITGDCSGWFLQNLEIWFLGAVVFTGKIAEVIA